MSNFETTNRGALFQPHSDQTFAASGKIDIEGEETRYVALRERISRDGEPVLVLYRRAGVLFTNDRSGNDKAPDYSGPLDANPEKRVAAWRQEKEGRRYMSIKVSDRRRGNGGGGGGFGGEEIGADLDADQAIPF